MPNFSGKPHVPPGPNEGALATAIEAVLPRHVHIHTPLLSAQCFDPDAYGNHCQCHKDFIADLLTNEKTTTV
jgi:hypothetical protein